LPVQLINFGLPILLSLLFSPTKACAIASVAIFFQLFTRVACTPNSAVIWFIVFCCRIASNATFFLKSVCDFYVPLSFQFPLIFASHSILIAGLKFREYHKLRSRVARRKLCPFALYCKIPACARMTALHAAASWWKLNQGGLAMALQQRIA
jgi:hypothetical protein